MQEASEGTVLGDFHDSEFSKDGRFLVRTDGPDGKFADLEITYTFGFTPLQQYLVGFPGGRLQALSIAWDSRPSEQGGQRRFHLYPNERIDHQDELHWTKRSQNCITAWGCCRRGGRIFRRPCLPSSGRRNSSPQIRASAMDMPSPYAVPAARARRGR
ncbi:MAG TPA: hypothetical protein VNL74_02610 [Methylococcus sp.]|nr:hypothetical protein [Methylococcus sp.]